MALSDLDAIRVYSDPTLTAREKIARITGVPQMPRIGPDQRLAQVSPGNVSDVRTDAGGGGAGGAPGAAAAPVSYAAGGAAPAVPTPGGGESTAGNVPASAQPTYVRPAGPDELERSAPPEVPEPELFDEGAPGEGAGEVDGGDFRSFARRSLLRGAGGAPAKPTERVREETQLQGGGLSPEDFNELAAAGELKDFHAMRGAVLQAGLEQDASNIRLAAEERAMAERNALAEIRQRTMEKTARIRAKQDEISEQIAATNPAEESLWAGKNFGEKLQTFLSVGLVALGAGAAKDPKMGAETVRAMANREVERQARFLAAKKGQLEAMGTILERHLANFGDAEVAHRQAVIDILGKAEFEVAQMAKDPRNTVLKSHNLMAQQAALREARLKEQGALKSELGQKLSVATAKEWVQERKLQPPPAPMAQPAAQPVPGAAAANPADQQLAAELDASGLDFTPVSADDKAEAKAAGFLPEPGEAPATKPAALAPKALAAKPGAKPAAAPAPEGGERDRFSLARKAFGAGRFDVVERALSDRDWQHINVITKRYKQAGSVGTSGNTTEEEARAYAIADYLDVPLPSSYVPASARERLVKLPGGVNVFASSAAHAEKLKTFVPNVQSVFASLNKLAAMADMGGRGWSPELKAEAENTSKAIMFYLSTAMEQGVVREGELPIWEKLTGGNMADYIQDPRRNAKAGIKATVGVLRRKLNAELAGVTLDPFGERAYKPKWAQ